MITWFNNVWQLIKGAFDLAAEVGVDDAAFLGLEWPYNSLEHHENGDDN